MGARIAALALCGLAALAAPGGTGGLRAAESGPDLVPLFDAALADVGPPLRVYRLAVDWRGGAELLVQRNERPDLVDRFTLADGAVSGPSPVKFSEYPTVEAIDFHVIDAREIDLGLLPTLVARAREKLGMPDAAVSRITLERDDSDGFLTVTDVPIWELHLGNRRHDGYVQFDLRGKLLHHAKDY